MKRSEAIRAVAEHLGPDSLAVSCNGMITRELYSACDRPENFYMIGSMGLASSIGLGLALRRPERKVVVLDGDGNLLMNLGTLADVAALASKNFYHVVLDNGVHDSTGGQRTVSRAVPLEKVAAAAGYARCLRVASAAALAEALATFLSRPGPAMLLVEVEPGGVRGIGRMEIPPPELARRFRNRVTGTA
ncbi:MAG: hypothetical protein HY720_30280 [Planctomycetes bacterium]|nr:hypothetical protein [Planctomycetota bacterium]